MVEESTQALQEEQEAYSNDQLVRAQIIEIKDDMPEEVKRQLQQFNEMSMMLNNSLDAPIAEEADTNDDDDEVNAEDSSPAPSFSENSEAVYSDIF
jgi:hypothetical protein